MLVLLIHRHFGLIFSERSLLRPRLLLLENIKAGQHNETFLGYRTVNAQEGRLMSSATDEE